MSDTMQFWLDVRAGLLQIVDAIERLPEANVHPTTAELRRQARDERRTVKWGSWEHPVQVRTEVPGSLAHLGHNDI